MRTPLYFFYFSFFKESVDLEISFYISAVSMLKSRFCKVFARPNIHIYIYKGTRGRKKRKGRKRINMLSRSKVAFGRSQMQASVLSMNISIIYRKNLASFFKEKFTFTFTKKDR